MHCDYLKNEASTIHAINCDFEDGDLEIGALCVISCQETTTIISNELHSFTVELPKEFRSGSERVKAFNVTLTVLHHEQV